jgi:hypothetical protein
LPCFTSPSSNLILVSLTSVLRWFSSVLKWHDNLLRLHGLNLANTFRRLNEEELLLRTFLELPDIDSVHILHIVRRVPRIIALTTDHSASCDHHHTSRHN